MSLARPKAKKSYDTRVQNDEYYKGDNTNLGVWN